jgi:hypothetical protein
MPYQIEKLPSGKFRVVNTETGEIHAKSTTKKNAQAQINLLRGVEHGDWKPTGKKKSGNGIKMTWIQFWASKSKGKKFASREERHKFMQKCLQQWRTKKGRGNELLLEPGLGATTGKYTHPL